MVKAHLVPSVAGEHEGWPNVLMTGHVRLMKAVRDMGLRTGKGKGKQLLLESPPLTVCCPPYHTGC